MSFWTIVLIIAVTAGATTWMGYRCTRESRKLLDEKRAAEAKKAADEVMRLAREEGDRTMLDAVAKALKVLFSEARDYSHAVEEKRRFSGYHYGETPPKFPREIREGFQKVLRVSTLETKMDEMVKGLDIIANHRRDLINQVSEIHKVLKDYA